MNNNIAIIDLGTNTFHLLIAEKNANDYTTLYRERLPVRIGQKGITQNIIQADAIERAVQALSSFKSTIDQYQVSTVFAFGTSALRNAKNAADVLTQIKENTGIEVTIISGEREAELIFLGVKSGLDLSKKKSLIMDIGGGSVEFIIGNNKEIFWKKSFEIGAQRLLEAFQKNDPITNAEILTLENYFDSVLQSLFEALAQHQPNILVGSSGTFDTLSDIYCIKHDVMKNQQEAETPLSMPGFYEVFEELLIKNRNDRMQIPGMIEMRVDMIVVACCLVRYLLENHTFETIRVSTYALKEGILASLKA